MMWRVLPPAIGPVPARALADAAIAAIGGAPAAPLSEALRVALVRAFPSRQVLLTDSGTSALTKALECTSTGAERAPIVALPAWCCPDVGTAAIAAAHRIMLYDLDPRTLLPDLASVERCLAAGAQKLVIVHFFGRLTDPDGVASLAERYGAVVIEDAAQGAGGVMAGKPAGTLAEWGVLSFGRGKGRNASGGGALTSTHALPAMAIDERTLAESVRTLIMTLATVVLARPRAYGVVASLPFLGLGDTVYKAPSRDRGPSVVTRALLPAVLAAADAEAEGRRAVALLWRQELGESFDGLLDEVASHTVDGALRFPTHMPPATASLLRAQGAVRSYPRTLDAYSEIAARLIPVDQAYPGARLLAAQLHTLPTHRFVTAADMARVRAILRGG
jgi:dTDP-4-amino-4,6-dideoxygalactose transaminase